MCLCDQLRKLFAKERPVGRMSLEPWFMAPQLQQTVCENTSNATSDAASCFVDTDFIWMVTALQFLIILTELIKNNVGIWCERWHIY